MIKFIIPSRLDSIYFASVAKLTPKNAKAVYKVLCGDFTDISDVKKIHSESNPDSFEDYVTIQKFKDLNFLSDSFLEWNSEIFISNNIISGQMVYYSGLEDLELLIASPEAFCFSRFYKIISLFYLFHKNESYYKLFLNNLIKYFENTKDFLFKNFDNRNKRKLPNYINGNNDDPYREILEIICLKRSVTVENGSQKPYSVSYYYPDLKECNFVEMLKLAGCNELADFYIKNIYKRAWKYLSNHEELFDLKYLN